MNSACWRLTTSLSLSCDSARFLDSILVTSSIFTSKRRSKLPHSLQTLKYLDINVSLTFETQTELFVVVILKQNSNYTIKVVMNFLMMTSSNGNISRITGPLCGEFTGHRWIPLTQRPVTRSFDVSFDLRLNKRLSKQWWGWWFETPSWSLWRHCNVYSFRSLWLASDLVTVLSIMVFGVKIIT